MKTKAAWLALLALGCGPSDGLSRLSVTVLYPPKDTPSKALEVALRQGIVQARIGSDFTLTEYTPESSAEAPELLEQALGPHQGRRLVITAGGTYAAAIDARNCALNGAQVLQLPGSPRPCASLRSVELQLFGPAFQAGVLAVSAESLAPRRSAGVIFAPPWRDDDALIKGFTRGAAYAGGQVETLALPAFEEALTQADSIRAQVAALVEVVDVLFLAGDMDLSLVLDAVNVHNAKHPSAPLHMIAIDQDLSLLDAQLALASIVRHFDIEVRLSILAAEVDAFSPGQVLRGFRDGQTELLINPTYAELPLDVQPFPGCEACATLADAVSVAEDASGAAEADSQD